MATMKEQIDALGKRLGAVEKKVEAITATPVAPANPAKPDKQIDWTLSGLATTEHHTATGKWERVLIFSDGSREGPETPARVSEPPAAPTPAPEAPTAPVGTEIPAPVPVETAPAGDVVWSGLDKLRHRYGHVWEHDGQLDVASWAGEGFQPSGAMQKPQEDGQGYGIYTMEMSGSKSNAPGKFACIWPKNDKWHWEIDIVENDYDGKAIATLHWGAVKNDGTNGEDKSEMKYLEGIRADDRHIYVCEWSRDLIVIKVDGVEKARFTENVPRDASDGGPTDGLMGIGTQPAWAAHAQNGNQVFTLHSCSYSKFK